MKKEPKRLSSNQKERLFKMLKEGISLRKISDELGISYLTAYNYSQKVKSNKTDDITQRLDRIERTLNDIYQIINQSKRVDLYQDINQEKKIFQELIKSDLNKDIYQVEISKNPDDYVDYDEASRLLGIKHKNLWKPIKKGFLIKIPKKDLGIPGKGFMILKSSIENYKKHLKRD